MQIIGAQKSYIVARIVPLLLMLVLILCAGVVTVHGQGTVNPPVYINAYLDGACEIPANDSAYTGTAGMAYTSPDSNLPVTNMVVACNVMLQTNFPAVDAGIYGPVSPFQAGPLLFDLGQPSLITNILVAESLFGTIIATNVYFGYFTNLSLTPQQFSDLNAGLLYVNVTSGAFPSGEIRGQFSNQPILSKPAFQNGNGVAFNLTCADQVSAPSSYKNYEVQVSTDLLNWTTFTDFYHMTNIVFQVVDAEATNTSESQRFYRVREYQSF